MGGSTVGAGDQRSSLPKTTSPSAAKLIEVPGGPSAALAKPLPPAVFILRNGERLEAHKYTITSDSVRVDAQGQERTIPLTALDVKATIAANHKRSIELKIPTNLSEISLGF